MTDLRMSILRNFIRTQSVAAAFAAGLGLASFSWSGSVRAQATSDCYFDPPVTGRMVDAQVLMGTKRQTTETTGGLHYLQYLPNKHDPAKKWPVIVFMHGIGEVNANAGDTTLNALTKHSLPRIVEGPTWDWPFIVISPQIDGAGWLSHASQIAAALDHVEQAFGGDPNRIYLTGLSYGGVGTLAVGIALADRIAALMPVTPGGGVDNWDQRSKIASMPIWLFNGLKDAEYNTNSTRVMDLEKVTGQSPFFRYTYAFADEYKDIVPLQALTEHHVFGSYENIGHDVWHAAYGVYCPTLTSTKTTQYKWLLSQSRDGSAFVDPRGSTVGGAGAGGGAGGSSGSAGATTAGGAGATAIGGASATASGGNGGALGTAGGAGAATIPSAGAGGEAAVPALGVPGENDAGCQCSAVGEPSGRRGSGALWAALGVVLAARVRRKRG